MSQTVKDLQDRVNTLKNIFDTLLATYSTLDPNIQQQVTTGINNAFGQACGMEHEYLRANKMLGKGRAVITQKHGDVTAGAATDLFSKTIECKSITAPDHASVNSQIRKAFNQLGGGTGSLPRKGDARILDVFIRGVENPWPMGGGTYGTDRHATQGIPKLDDISSNACSEIAKLLNEPNAKPLVDWLNGQTVIVGAPKMLKDIPGSTNLSSTRPVYQIPSVISPGTFKTYGIRSLTIKIRYENPYFIKNPTTKYGLDEMIIQCFKKPGHATLPVELVKYKLYDYDATTHTYLSTITKHYNPY